MSNSESAYCGNCKKEVGYHYDPINHIKHLLLTICSLGIWLPIWVCVVVAPSKMCDQCGNPIWSDQPAKVAKQQV